MILQTRMDHTKTPELTQGELGAVVLVVGRHWISVLHLMPPIRYLRLGFVNITAANGKSH